MSDIPDKISFKDLQNFQLTASPGVAPLKGKDFKQYCEDQITELSDIVAEMDEVISDNIPPDRWEYFDKARIRLRTAINLLSISIKT